MVRGFFIGFSIAYWGGGVEGKSCLLCRNYAPKKTN